MSILRSILEALLGASGKAPKGGGRPSPPVEPDPAPRHEPGREEPRTTDPAAAIRTWVADWRGVPYQMGGTDRSGIDCSGFVRGMYRELFSCSLPRTSRDQAQQGREVGQSDLRPGDLVFFKISDRTRHVGAYLGGGTFGHASTSKGPAVSSLDSDYWKSRYWTARRVL